MEYSKQTWADTAAGGTPISAARLQHIEDGVAYISTRGTYRDSLLAGTGLRSSLSSQTPARTTTPTLTLGTSADAATPTQVKAVNSGVINPVFRLTGFEYMPAGSVFPDSECVRATPLPQFPVGFGHAVADFVDDAPAISFIHMRSQLGATRVFCDGVEILRVGTATRAGTAQAGAASTITLDSGASATTGWYLGQWIRTTGGTGSGQFAQITGYVGSTKVATVSPAWVTVPDATTTFEVTPTRMQFSNSTNSGVSTYFIKADWNGERRHRHYRVETSGCAFRGIYHTSAIDSIYPVASPDGVDTFWCGDSFGAGTGTDAWFSSLSRVCCDQLGWRLHTLSIGGTGFLNPGTNSLVFSDRLLPPINAWSIWTKGVTSGTMTLTQSGVTTGTIAYNASIATIQTAVDTAFGAGKYNVVGDSGQSFQILGLGATAASAAAMTADFSALSVAGTKQITQWLGNLAPQVPLDGNGAVLPFNIILEGVHNDTTSNNAAYTTTLLQSTMSALITALQTKYPSATIYVIGGMYLPGGSVPAALTNASTAALAATVASANEVNGQTPFIDSLTVPWMTGTGSAAAPAGNGNSDLTCANDGIHPTPGGHFLYGVRDAQAIEALGLSL